MRKSRYSDSQIMAILKEAEGGTPVPALCREHGMSSATFLQVACQVWRYGRLLDEADERAGSREQAA